MSNQYDQIIDALMMKADSDELPVVQFTTSTNANTVRNNLRYKYSRLIADHRAMDIPVAYNNINISHPDTSNKLEFRVQLSNNLRVPKKDGFEFTIL